MTEAVGATLSLSMEVTRMNGTLISLVAFAIAFAGSVHAQGCSGGPDGGMDATGNQCSDPGGVAYTTAPAPAPLLTAAPGIVPAKAGSSIAAPAPRAMRTPVGPTSVAAVAGLPVRAKRPLGESTR